VHTNTGPSPRVCEPMYKALASPKVNNIACIHDLTDLHFCPNLPFIALNNANTLCFVTSTAFETYCFTEKRKCFTVVSHVVPLVVPSALVL